MATAAVLCIGTELVRGEIVNTNASWLCERLTDLGFEVAIVEVVADDRAAIREALRTLSSHAVVVCTGGLGPTTDDITTECVAAELGVALERDPASFDAIRERMERFGRRMAESNAKQADFPRGAAILANPHGTAPGFSVRVGRGLAAFLPGVPREMKPMFDTSVVPLIAGLATGGTRQVRLVTFGAPESTINDDLAGIEEELGVTLGYRAHFPEIEVKILAREASPEAAEDRVRRAVARVRERLGDLVHDDGGRSLPEVVARLARERRTTLAMAESCTGGLCAHLLTQHAGASEFFVGGVVAYSNAVKTSALGVDERLLAAHGAVSEPVARAMAEGVRRRLGADVGLSFTGVAGPGGGTPEKPVGRVHVALASATGTEHRELTYPGSREQVQRLSAFAGLTLVRRLLGARAESTP